MYKNNKMEGYNLYIYKLYNDAKEIIYIGKTVNDINLGIRTHFSNYNNYNNLDNLWRIDIRYYDYAELNEIDASIYEIYLINKYQPKYNITYKHEEESTLDLPELDFSEKFWVESAGIDLEYYKNLYEDIIKEKVNNGIDIPSLTEEQEIIEKVYTYKDSQTKKMLNKIKWSDKRNKERDLLIIKLMLFLGLKLNETTGIQLKDIGMEKGVLYLKDRILPIPADLLEEIENYITCNEENLTENDYLFQSTRGNRINDRTVQLFIKDYLGDMDITANDLRNHFILNLTNFSSNNSLFANMLNIEKARLYQILDELKE